MQRSNYLQDDSRPYFYVKATAQYQYSLSTFHIGAPVNLTGLANEVGIQKLVDWLLYCWLFEQFNVLDIPIAFAALFYNGQARK